MCDNELLMRACVPISEDTAPLTGHDLEHMLSHAEGWEFDQGGLVKTFEFADHYQTMAFVGAVAWISHREDHCPEMVVRRISCTLRYETAAIGGVSINDFICSAKVDHLVGD